MKLYMLNQLFKKQILMWIQKKHPFDPLDGPLIYPSKGPPICPSKRVICLSLKKGH